MEKKIIKLLLPFGLVERIEGVRDACGFTSTTNTLVFLINKGLEGIKNEVETRGRKKKEKESDLCIAPFMGVNKFYTREEYDVLFADYVKNELTYKQDKDWWDTEGNVLTADNVFIYAPDLAERINEEGGYWLPDDSKRVLVVRK